MAIMVLMQSSGKYDIHRNMFSSERAMSASSARTSIGAAVSLGSPGIPTKSITKALVFTDYSLLECKLQ
jgi:hypothetical protein